MRNVPGTEQLASKPSRMWLGGKRSSLGAWQKLYSTDLNDTAWALVSPLLPPLVLVAEYALRPLGDGYFAFDFGDVGPPVTWWYDEYAFDLLNSCILPQPSEICVRAYPQKKAKMIRVHGLVAAGGTSDTECVRSTHRGHAADETLESLRIAQRRLANGDACRGTGRARAVLARFGAKPFRGWRPSWLRVRTQGFDLKLRDFWETWRMTLQRRYSRGLYRTRMRTSASRHLLP